MKSETHDNPSIHGIDGDTIMTDVVKLHDNSEKSTTSVALNQISSASSIKTQSITPSNIQPLTSMSYNINMKITDDMIFRTVSNRLNYIQEATESTRISPFANTTTLYQEKQVTHQSNASIIDARTKQTESIQVNETTVSNVPSLETALEAIYNIRPLSLPKKQLWNPFNLEHLPKGEECDIIESSFGRKVKLEHSMMHSSSSIPSNNAQPSVLIFSSSLKHVTESIMQQPGSTRARLSYFADQAKRHSNLGHRHLEALANLLMQIVHDEMHKIAQISGLIDDVSTQILFHNISDNQSSIDSQNNDNVSIQTEKRLGNSNVSKSQKTEFMDFTLQLGDIFTIILDKLMSDILRREEMIEGLRTLRKSIVHLIQLNEIMFSTLKKFRSKRYHSNMPIEEQLLE